MSRRKLDRLEALAARRRPATLDDSALKLPDDPRVREALRAFEEACALLPAEARGPLSDDPRGWAAWRRAWSDPALEPLHDEIRERAHALLLLAAEMNPNPWRGTTPQTGSDR